MQPLPRLILATRNVHKTEEIRTMIGDRFEVLDATTFPDFPEIAETGTTFLENARLKAEGISRCIEGWVLSDDSGLEVDALGGAPGVWSSSYGGEEGNHAKNNTRLLAEMAGKADRKARFRCTMVLARGGSELATFSGTVEGHLVESLHGVGGFGYDPLFVPDGHEKTFAELGEEAKNSLSHRARALQQVVAFLDGVGQNSLPFLMNFEKLFAVKSFSLVLTICLPLVSGLVSCSSQVKARQPVSYRFESGRTALVKDGLAYAPRNAPAPVIRAIAAGNRLQGKPYKWGGGHARLQDSGYDCSGTVSYVLREAGLLKGSMPSKGYFSYGKKGEGKWITLYVRNGHVFMTVAGLRLDTGGPGGETGPRWKTATRQGKGHVMRHPAGL